MTINKTKKIIFGHIMMQMSKKKGLKKHRKAGKEALLQEFTQLEDLLVFEALDPKTTLTDAQKRGALQAIKLLSKEKPDGQLKGRTVADGRPQQSMYNKSETASPTVSTDALMLLIIVDAHERDVATADAAGAYLKADLDNFVVMKFMGVSINIMSRMNPQCQKYVVNGRGGKAL